MKLSISVRVAEKFSNKREASMGLDGLVRLAAASGYHAVCMRASQVGLHTPPEVVEEKREMLDAMGLKVSMVTGDFAIPENNDECPNALRNITPYLDLAEALGATLLRVGIKKAEDIPWTQRAADEAAERGMALAQQSHNRSPFETVEESVRYLKSINRRNFGITYEPANLELCGADYGPSTIRAFAPYLLNVYLQNQRLRPDGPNVIETWSRGPVRFEQIPMWDTRGIDFPAVLRALEQVGYEGYVTVHQASTGTITPEEAITKSAAYLRSLGRFDPA
ncbi:MAG: sugar phosphate isomerase/epimerase [SAR202 cluster bacterium]|nr:sugar phosphate isomerase/epimerase [SAR202 cluster bacterium]